MARLLYRLETESGCGPWTDLHKSHDARCPEGMRYATQSLRNVRWWVDLDKPRALQHCKLSVYRAKKHVPFPRVTKLTNGDDYQNDLKYLGKCETVSTREVWFNPENAELVARIPLEKLGIKFS